MAVKNYYAILGVPRDESAAGIRAAFRDLARRHHPDLAGAEGVPAFREIVEAYRVLSDPEARRGYDAQLPGGGSRFRVRRESVRPAARRRRPEPLDPMSIVERADAVRPSMDALFDRLLRNFTGIGVPKAERREPLFCDVSLSPAEAHSGGVLPIRLPGREPCPRCHGTGHAASFLCPTCDARGEVEREVVIPLRIPPGVQPGAELDVALEPWGIRNLWLRVRIGVR